MACIRLGGALRAASIAFVSTICIATPASATDFGQGLSPAAAAWHLRSGLNVAALACRGPDEGAIVAGYNRLLASRRAELADVYRAVSREYGSAAAFDAAMTRLYNLFAQPASQAALCANALAVLEAAAAHDRPLGEGFATTALAVLAGEGEPSPSTRQIAVAAIPHILDERQPAPHERDYRRQPDPRDYEPAYEAEYRGGDVEGE